MSPPPSAPTPPPRGRGQGPGAAAGASRAVTIGVCGLLVVSAGLLLHEAGTPRSSTTGALTLARNIDDPMTEAVSSGLGDATIGGRWDAEPPTAFRVAGGHARLGPIGPREAVSATVAGLSTADELVRTTVIAPATPTDGKGLYFGLLLRRQANGDGYRAQLGFLPSGKVTLGLVRTSVAQRTPVAPPVQLGAVRPGTPLTLRASVSGTDGVLLSADVARPHAAPLRTTVTDTSARRVATAGRYGLWAYNSPGADQQSLSVAGMSGWLLGPGVPGLPTLFPTTSPSSKPSGSRSPSTAPSPSHSQGSPSPSTGGNGGGGGGGGTGDSGGEVGAAPPGNTSYAVPANAVFVSPAGSDAGKGTQASPLHTVARAIAVAPNGATIVMRGGTYHESVTIPEKKRLTLQSYPGEAVWFDGTVPVSTWSKQGNAWVHNGWTAHFDSTAGYDAQQARQYAWTNSAHPMAAHPDEVFVDGAQLQQAKSLSSMGPNSFYVDYSAKKLYLGQNPYGHQVRAADLQIAMEVKSAGTVLRGFGVRRYATSVPQLGTVNLIGDDQRIENVTISETATQGLRLRGTGIDVDHVSAIGNGLSGIHLNQSDRSTIRFSVIQGNNSEFFNPSPVAGGIKITRSEYDLVQGNLITDNHGNGLWFDTSSYGMTVIGNDALNNDRIGISFELSAAGLVANNDASNNGFDGIRICDTNNMRVWNNTLSGNAMRNLDITQDSRVQHKDSFGRDPRRPWPDSKLTWVTKDIEVHDNLVANGGPFHVWISDYRHRTPKQINLDVDGNLFSAPAQRGYAVFAIDQGNHRIDKQSTRTWGQKYGWKRNVTSKSKTRRGMSGDAKQTSDAIPLPDDIAHILGVAPGTKAYGAF